MTISDDEQEWIAKIDADSEELSVNKDELYQVVKEGFEKFDGKSKPELLWRMSRAAYKVAAAAELVKNTEKQKKFLQEATEWGKKALELDEKHGKAHMWLANIYGKVCDHLGTKERIAKGKEIQAHLEACITSMPDDFLPYYTYGRWCMEVAKLSWLERKIAAAIFDKPPEATYQDAVDKFTIVDRLKPSWRANKFYLAKSYIQLKQLKSAIEALDAGLGFESLDEEDSLISEEMASLQKKYASHRA